jgi:hypothetical protein
MKKSLKNFTLVVVAATGIGWTQVAVEADAGSGKLIQGVNTGSQASDGVGVYGESKPAPWYGIGVKGVGGYQGVNGQATLSGSHSRYGGYFTASGGSNTNYGVYSYATGGTNSYAGYFSGNVHVTGTFTNPSDERLKKNIAPLTGSLAKLKNLRPSSYYFDDSAIPMKGLSKQKQLGLMAGDVESVFPELVHNIPVPPDEEKGERESKESINSVNYIGLIPVLIDAIQEQQAQIEILKAALKKK